MWDGTHEHPCGVTGQAACPLLHLLAPNVLKRTQLRHWRIQQRRWRAVPGVWEPEFPSRVAVEGGIFMAKKAKKTSRGRKQDRARVAGGQDYEVRYEAKKTGKPKSQVKAATK